MKKTTISVVALAVAACLLFIVRGSASAVEGNGAPDGAYFDLEITGIPSEKTTSMDISNEHRILIPLKGKAKILLAPGAEFAVTDENGIDENGASFQLPDPFRSEESLITYSVWIRSSGEKNGKTVLKPCINTGEDIYCSTGNIVQVRKKDTNTFTNVTSQLLYLYVDLFGGGVKERYSLFDNFLKAYFWNEDNNGNRTARFRFYRN